MSFPTSVSLVCFSCLYVPCLYVSPYNSEQIKLSMMQLWHLDIIDCAYNSDLHKILKSDVEFLKVVLFISTVFLSYL